MTRVAQERLKLTKTADRKIVDAGKNVRFTVTLRSTGLAPARSVQICDRLPPHMTFVSAPGARFVMGKACWHRTLMPRGSAFRRVIVAKVDQDAPAGTERNVVIATAHSPIRLSAHAKVKVRPVPRRLHRR